MAASITRLPTAAAAPVANPRLRGRKPSGVPYLPTILAKRSTFHARAPDGSRDDITADESLFLASVSRLSDMSKWRLLGFMEALGAHCK